MPRLLIALLLFVPSALLADGISIFVSVPPLQFLAERVGGDLVKVESMVGPGHNPVSYDPGPAQIGRLAKAALFVRTGVPWEEVWMKRLVRLNPEMRVLDARLGLPIESFASHRHGGHGHDSDPHVWTSLPNAVVIAKNITRGLLELDPGNSSYYLDNFERLKQELDQRHHQIAASLEDYRGKSFMVFHPAWGYFAQTYGVNQVAVEEEGKEPGPRKMAQLIEEARDHRISAIFVQPQFNTALVAVIAEETGATVIEVDPLVREFPDSIAKVAEGIADER